MRITVSEVILNYGMPLVVLATSEKGHNFVGINYDDPEDGTPYKFYFVQPRPKCLDQFLEQKIDLRYLITHCSYSKKYHSATWGDVGEAVNCAHLVDEISEDMLPEPRLFNPAPIPRSQFVSAKKILIDGRWDVADLSLFADLIRDCYAFAYALTKGPSIQLRAIFEHYPWRGGSSSLNFFRELSSVIQSGERVKLTQMQYASPGYIEFSLREDVASLIKDLVADINMQESPAKAAYNSARSYLRDRNLLGRSRDDISDLTGDQINEFSEILGALCTSFGLDAYRGNIAGLSQGNPLAGIKILLAFYRRLSKFADYSATGKAVKIFA